MSSRSFTVFGKPTREATSRIGITVTRRVGTAAARNRIKRCLREIFRRNRSALQPTMDLVVNAHRTIDARNATALEAEFLTSFARLVRRARP